MVIKLKKFSHVLCALIYPIFAGLVTIILCLFFLLILLERKVLTFNDPEKSHKCYDINIILGSQFKFKLLMYLLFNRNDVKTSILKNGIRIKSERTVQTSYGSKVWKQAENSAQGLLLNGNKF